MVKSFGSGLKAFVGASSIAFALLAGSAVAATINATSYTLPDGTTTVNIYDSVKAPEGSAPGTASNITAGMINLQTSIGALQTYCVDLFDYIQPPTTYNVNALTTASQYSNGSATLNFSAAQVNVLTRLLTNGTLQTQSLINTTALQLAIWEVEYDTAAANGSYNLTVQMPADFYFTATGDSNSSAALAQAQTYLNDATGYQNGGSFVSAIWQTDSTKYVQYLTAVGGGAQNLITLATPEPSTIAIFAMGLVGLLVARRRKMI